MRVTVKSPSKLTEGELARWREIQSSESTFDSPFFCPEFIQLVDNVRSCLLYTSDAADE